MEQKRFLLAMVLSGAVLVIWQVFLAPQPPEEQPPAEQAVEAPEDQAADEDQADGAERADGAEGADQDAAAPQEPGAEAEPMAEAGAEADAERPQVDRREDVIKTRWFTLDMTNAHGSVTSVHLTEPEQYVEAGDLVGFPDDATKYPFRTAFLDGNLDFPENPVYEVVEKQSVATDGGFSKLVYRYEDPQGRFTVDKIFEVDPDLAFVVNMDVVLTNNLSEGTLVDTLAVDILDWKNPNEESSFLDFRPNELEGVCRNTEDLERESYDNLLEDGSQRFAAGETQWAGVDTRYFLMAAIPEEPAQRCELEVIDDNYVRARLVNQTMSVPAGSSKTMAHQLFLGPKDVDNLNEVGNRLEESVDYGFFAFIARPMRWGLNQLHGFLGNWGLAIILLTFLIRGALWPVNMKAYSSMERMKKVQPILKEVKEKYDDDRQRMTEETMKIFKEHNVSPAGGCLPMIMQMPILYGLYVMIYNSVDLYHADFMLWYTNLAEPDPYYVLPALMGIVMFAQQRMSTVDQTNKQAAMMMKIMPVMFTAFMVFLPSGLVLYYALSLLIGVLQQFYVRKRFSDEDEITTAEAS